MPSAHAQHARDQQHRHKHDEHHHHHHEMPTSGSALTSVAISATLHCLTGCAIGEVLGMVIGTSLGFSEWGTVALAVGLAFLFGYALTSLPLLRAGLSLSAVVPIALAADTFSIAVMEIVDNALMLGIPGAMEAGVGDILFWGALAVALVVAGIFAVPVNRWLIARGKGHAVVHETGIHGGPSPKLVGAIAAVAAVFGSTVLIAEAMSGDGMGHEEARPGAAMGEHGAGHGDGGHAGGSEADSVRGLTPSAGGLTLSLTGTELPRGERSELRFRILGEGGEPVREFEVEHDKRMHLILARDDLTGFQHLHPRMASDGTWSTPVTLPDAGRYRVFADFKHDGENQTLARTLTVDGRAKRLPLPPPAATAQVDGYQVHLDAGPSHAGRPAELAFHVSRDGLPVQVQDYLGAKGHLVALRESDLAYLHTHPAEGAAHGGGEAQGGEEGHGGHGGAEAPAGGDGHGGHADHGAAVVAEPVRFETEFPSPGRYRLFVQFKHEGRVHTAAFTRILEH